MRSSHFAVVTVALACAACGSSGSNGAHGSGDGGPQTAVEGGAAGDDAGGDAGAGACDGAAPPSDGQSPPGDDGGSPVTPPPALSIDVSQTSVSGISAGGFMAVQFGVAFSSIVQGIAVFAGGPFGCSQGSLATAETQCTSGSTAPDVTPLIASTKSLASSGAIDATSYLAKERIYLFGGADDQVVNPVVMDAAQSYFEGFIPTSAIQYESRRAATGHTMPTLSYGGSCDSNDSPWIGDCGYDGAGIALAQIYGTLVAASSAPSGKISALAQGDFVTSPASHSLADTGYVYVPASCASGETCRVHVAFHGCDMQATGAVGSEYYLHAGYNVWADTNHIVVLYPQATTSSADPNACWDWWGYDSADYDTQSAPQMAMVRKMISYLAAPGDGGDGG